MKKAFLGLVALVGLYVGAALVLSLQAKSKADAFNAELKRLGAMADAVTPGAPTSTLAEACAKVPRVGRLGLIAYFQKPGPGLIGEETEKKYYDTKQFRAFSPERVKVEGAHIATFPWGVEWWLFDFLGSEPWRWDWVLGGAVRPFNRDPSEMKYLVVHQLDSLTLPRVRSTDYDPGRMTFRSVLLDTKTGAVLCEGSTELEQTGTVHVAASAATKWQAEERLEGKKEEEVFSMFFIDLHFFALRDLCWLGDEVLCKETFGKFVAPP